MKFALIVLFTICVAVNAEQATVFSEMRELQNATQQLKTQIQHQNNISPTCGNLLFVRQTVSTKPLTVQILSL